MVVGLVLGPSVLGMVAPSVQRLLFPATLEMHGPDGSLMTLMHPSMSILYAFSQVGLVLYMFLIGLRLDLRLLGQHSRLAASVSVAGIVTPLLLGGGLGLVLAGDKRLFGTHTSPAAAAIFVAAALSITAFPTLARIVHEHHLTGTRLGTLALGAAAVDDAAAWSLLALVLAMSTGNLMIAVLALGGGVSYAAVVLIAGRPLLRHLDRQSTGGAQAAREVFALILILLLLCAWFTDVTGIYAVFGAFLAGAALPRGKLAADAIQAIEPLTVTLLVPIFFVYAGLSSRLDLLLAPSMLGLTLLVIVIAFAAKGLACGLASRQAGASWREASALGILMNARGLMELVLITIGLDRGLITPALYTILLLMAVVTTVVTTPLFHAVWQASPRTPATPVPVVLRPE
jgi:Kef-type K+ transport system membrane component KefB